MKACAKIVAVAFACLLGFAGPAFSASPQWKVAIELNDGARVVGVPTFKSIRFQTAAGATDISLRSLHSASLSNGVWLAYTEQGKTISGKVVPESLGVKTLVGPVDVPMRLVVGLEVYSTTIDVDLPAREDLVLYLNFDRNGGTRARNQASFRHHAEVRSARWIPDGKRKGAYEFDGDAQLVIPDHEELCPTAYTLAAWVFPNDPSGPWRQVIGKTKASFYGGYALCRYPKDNANLSFYVGEYGSAIVKQPVPQRQWTHVAGVCDGRHVQLFVNGEPSLPVPLTKGHTKHTETPLIIGGFGGYNWIGKIDEVMLYRRALSGQEIEQLMLAGSQRGKNE